MNDIIKEILNSTDFEEDEIHNLIKESLNKYGKILFLLEK